MNTDDHDDNLVPATDAPSLNQQQEPGKTNVVMPVPQDLAQAGNDTNIPYDDSPESLDEELSQGANREDIDPQHSIVRPAIDSIDKEENGVN